MDTTRRFGDLSLETRFWLRDPQQLEPLSSVERLKAFADDLAAVPEPVVRAAAALEIFGRSGAEFCVLCGFPKIERDQLIDAYLRTFGWAGLFDWLDV